MIVYIYTLEHPITSEIRYIGKCKNLSNRFGNHLNKGHNEKSHKRNWIEMLKKQGLKPVIKVLDEVDELDWQFWEKYWIKQFISWGFNLFNHTSGGDGSTFGNRGSFPKGNKPWNYGTAKPKVLKGNKGRSGNTIKTQFKKNQDPWNKGKSGYRLSGDRKANMVLQLDLNGNIIDEFLSCKDAAEKFNCIPENIRRVCVGMSKTARGYKWVYKK